MKKRYWTIGHRLPSYFSTPLFGDRQRFGREIQRSDPDWVNWQSFYMNFYQNTQKRGIGKIINDAGYRILRSINMDSKRVVEIGPGIIPHMQFWNGKPSHYTIIDNQQELLDLSGAILGSAQIPFSCYLTDSHLLPAQDGQFDVVISFYALEHLQPLDAYLIELKRILRPNGILIGAIPAEGGLAWGLGRYFTTRRYVKKHTSFSLDKIICWEHPNYSEEILQKLDGDFQVVHRKFWPSKLPMIDINLIISFIYQQRDE